MSFWPILLSYNEISMNIFQKNMYNFLLIAHVYEMCNRKDMYLANRQLNQEHKWIQVNDKTAMLRPDRHIKVTEYGIPI